MSSDDSAGGLRIAIIGAGPAAFYAAEALLSCGQPGVRVDMFDRLPTPFGLVRHGVAPDHQKIKTVTKAFARVAENPRFRFFGGVEYGRDLSLDDIRRHYHQVLFATGAQTDRRMGIPGEDLAGSHPATEFVAWYNGHPDFQGCEFDLSCRRAVVIGNGNVAVDVARMLALADEELAPTDTTDAAIAAILASPIEEIVVLGRRGPAEASFTTPELQELGELADTDIAVDPAELELEPASDAALSDTTVARNLEVMRGYAGRAPAGKRRTLRLRFRVSPVAIVGSDRVEGIEVARNTLVADGDGRVRAVATDEREVIPCGIVLRSVGYMGVPVPGVPFDAARATLANRGGRVVDDRGEQVPGVYCAGWIKRGPTGIIGTNKKDAHETVALLLEDARSGALPPREGGGAEAVDALLAERGAQVVTYAGWEAIDAAERSLGEACGRPRVKLVSWDELLAAAGG